MAVGVGVAFFAAVINKLLKLGLLSRIAERVTFVLIPPLALIFLVLGTIFLGVATPTEGGAMGATGALIMALARRRLSLPLLKQAMNTTAKLSTFVVFILVGARVFSLTFYGVNGHVWVEHLLTSLPGGQLGFLIVVNILIFVLAFFLDFFELSFIIIPLIGPVAEKLGIDLIWFGVLLARQHADVVHASAVRLRAVLPAQRRAGEGIVDRLTGRKTAPVTTGQIYWGAVPFVLIQVIMVGADHRVPEHRVGRPRDEGEGRHPEHPDRGADRGGRRPARRVRRRQPTSRTRRTKALENGDGRRSATSADKAPDAEAARRRTKAKRPASAPSDAGAAADAALQRQRRAGDALAEARRDARPVAARPLRARHVYFFCAIRCAAIMKLSKRFSATANHSTSLGAELLPRLVDLLELRRSWSAISS